MGITSQIAEQQRRMNLLASGGLLVEAAEQLRRMASPGLLVDAIHNGLAATVLRQAEERATIGRTLGRVEIDSDEDEAPTPTRKDVVVQRPKARGASRIRTKPRSAR